MKRLVAKVGEYEKDGQTKGEYLKVGVLMNGDNGEYLLLEPHVNLSGVLTKQNALAVNKGQQPRTSVMISVFDDSQQQNQQQPQQQAGGFQPQQQAPQQQAPAQGFDQSIPF